MAEDVLFQFRAACREQTREQIRAFLPGGPGRAQLAAMNGEPFVDSLLAHARETLASQQEPDGTNDVVTCPCGKKLRVPGARPARCPHCQWRVQ